MCMHMQGAKHMKPPTKMERLSVGWCGYLAASKASDIEIHAYNTRAPKYSRESAEGKLTAFKEGSVTVRYGNFSHHR
jgi:hypothetical protein